MLNIIVDNLSRLEEFVKYVPTLIQLGVGLSWIFITRRSKLKYQISLRVTLIFLTLSVITLLLTLKDIAGVLAQYAFLFLSISILQILLEQDEH